MWLQHPVGHVLSKKRPFSIFSYSSAQASASTSYTFGSATLSMPRQDRKLLIGIGSLDSVQNYSCSGITVDLDAATEVVTSPITGSFTLSALYIKDHPSGTTGSVVVTFSEGITECMVFIWCLYNLSSSTAVATANQFQSSSANLVLSAQVGAPGLVFGVGSVNGASPTVVWSGLDPVGILDGTALKTSVAESTAANYIPLHTIGCDWSGTDDAAGVSASFK